MKISEILTKHGTDKTFNNRNGHCYGETYDNLFEKYKRDSKISILEVGVHHGNSLGAWKESFPNAFVCGIDMVARLRRSNGNKFWGCKNYPNCKETLNMPKKLKAVSGKQIKVKPVNTGILGKYKKSKDY